MGDREGGNYELGEMGPDVQHGSEAASDQDLAAFRTDQARYVVDARHIGTSTPTGTYAFDPTPRSDGRGLQ